MKLTDAERAKLAAAIKHFEALQKRYTSTHNGTACEYVRLALIALDRLSQEPDGPDVVFCEDCVRFKDGECNSAYGLPDPVDETDFCSYGARMDADAPAAGGEDLNG